MRNIGGETECGAGAPTRLRRHTDPAPAHPLTEWIACAGTIAVGGVTEVHPSHGDSSVTLDLVDPRVTEARPPMEKGQRLLIVVPERTDQEASTFEGARLTQYRSTITKALDKAERETCPSPWNRTGQ